MPLVYSTALQIARKHRFRHAASRVESFDRSAVVVRSTF